MSVYCRLAANSIQKPSEKGEVSQNLLARIVVVEGTEEIRKIFVLFPHIN